MCPFRFPNTPQLAGEELGHRTSDREITVGLRSGTLSGNHVGQVVHAHVYHCHQAVVCGCGTGQGAVTLYGWEGSRWPGRRNGNIKMAKK